MIFRKSILIAGDANVWGLLAQSFFAREGFALLRAGEGAAAFGMVEEHDPALVIIDLGLPGMGECCLRIKEDPLLRSTPLLALLPSGGGDPIGRQLADLVQEKPAERRALLEAASLLLGITVRGEPRHPLQVAARYGKPEAKQYAGRILNLNTGGAFLATGRLYPVDTPLCLELTLPAANVIKCRGRVAWVNHPEWIKKPELPSGMGIEFRDLTADQRQLLLSFSAAAQGGEMVTPG